MTLEQFKYKNYGKPGTEKRDKLDAGFKYFKIGALKTTKKIIAT